MAPQLSDRVAGIIKGDNVHLVMKANGEAVTQITPASEFDAEDDYPDVHAYTDRTIYHSFTRFSVFHEDGGGIVISLEDAEQEGIECALDADYNF